MASAYYSIRLLPLALFALLIGQWKSACAKEDNSGDKICDSVSISAAGHYDLPEGCTYNKGIDIKNSNVSLNCHGAIFDGRNREDYGLVIDSEGKKLEYINIENCRFINFKRHGVLIGWNIPDGLKIGIKEELYSRTPREININSIEVAGSGKSGVYIDDYVEKVLISNSIIRDSGSVGIYLEHSSKNNKLLNNNLLRNGYKTKDGRAVREAIAVDSSANNEIIGNLFRENGRGGVFLYKNCSERAQDPLQVMRWQHSDNNLIKDNFFYNEKIGVHIASRQSKNLKSMRCGDNPMKSSDFYYEDYANNNVIMQNKFCKTISPVIIEGDGNKIIDNKFDSREISTVLLPKTKRAEMLGRPQVGNKIVGNSLVNCEEMK